MRRVWLWICWWPGVLAAAGAAPADEAKPKPLASIPVRGEAAHADAQWMEFLPSGRHLAVRFHRAGSADATVAVYDVGTGKPVASADVKGGGKSPPGGAPCGVSPTGDWVVYAEGESLRFLAVPPPPHGLPAKGRLDLPKRNGEPDDAIWVWPAGNGETAFVARVWLGTYELARWDLAKQTYRPVPRPGGHDFLSALALNASAGRVAAATWDGEAKKSGIHCSTLGDKPVKTDIPVPQRVRSLALAPDGKAVAAGFDDGSAAWYDTTTGKGVKPLPLERGSVGSVAFHPGGKHLACGTFDQGVPNLFLIDVASGEVVAKLIPDGKGVWAVCFSPGGDRLAVFGASGEVTVWNAAALLKLQRD